MQKHNYDWKNKVKGKFTIWLCLYKIHNLAKLNNALLRTTCVGITSPRQARPWCIRNSRLVPAESRDGQGACSGSEECQHSGFLSQRFVPGDLLVPFNIRVFIWAHAFVCAVFPILWIVGSKDTKPDIAIQWVKMAPRDLSFYQGTLVMRIKAVRGPHYLSITCYLCGCELFLLGTRDFKKSHIVVKASSWQQINTHNSHKSSSDHFTIQKD